MKCNFVNLDLLCDRKKLLLMHYSYTKPSTSSVSINQLLYLPFIQATYVSFKLIQWVFRSLPEYPGRWYCQGIWCKTIIIFYLYSTVLVSYIYLCSYWLFRWELQSKALLVKGPSAKSPSQSKALLVKSPPWLIGKQEGVWLVMPHLH